MSYHLPEVNFREQMEDIHNRWGLNKFSGRIMNLIYNEVRTLKPNQFEKVVNEIFIEGSYNAPTPKQFRKYAEPFVIQNRIDEKNKQSKTMTGFVVDSQIKYFGSSLLDILNGVDGAVEKFNKGLKQIDEMERKRKEKHGSRFKCNHCEDTGEVFAYEIKKPWKADIAFNCFCKASLNNPTRDTWGSRYKEYLQNKRMREVAS